MPDKNKIEKILEKYFNTENSYFYDGGTYWTIDGAVDKELSKELTDYIEKTNREAVEGFINYSLKPLCDADDEWHTIGIEWFLEDMETYLSQLSGDKKGNDYDNK